MSKLHNVRGRITYISSYAKQENLYAVYETTDRHYWTELARFNQQEFLKSGTEGKCIEARELIIALPEPIEKIATRNMFYNEQGRHVRTKKEIMDDNGNVRKGCKIIKKGDVYERTLFTNKNPLFKQEAFVDEAKRFYTDLINLLIEDDKDKLHIFDKNGVYLATKKIGKNNPKAEQIKADNEVRMQWNHEVDRAIVSQVPEDEIRQIKKEFITDRIRQSIDAWGRQPDMLASIIINATMRLALLISKVLTAARELKNKLFHEAIEKEYGNKADVKEESITNADITPVAEEVTKTEMTTVTETTVTKTEVIEAPKPQIPPRPVMPPEAAAYPKLRKIKTALDKQNETIFEAERERNALEFERNDLRGFIKLTKKKELDSRIAAKEKEIQILKAGLSGIVRQHGFVTVQDFYTAFYTTQRATDTYQKECAKWEEAYREKTTPKAETLQEKIQQYQEKDERQNNGRSINCTKEGGAR